MSTRALIVVSLVGAATAALMGTGCQQLQCADGTHEANGECVSEDPIGDATCGPGTHVENGVCTADFPPTECDESTTTPQIDPETGVIVCIGTTTAGCGENLPCPSDSTGSKHNICGRLVDVETGADITAAAPAVADCDAGGEADGPCALEIRFVDALVFAQDITDPGAVLTYDSLKRDDCGRFVARNVAHPGTNAIGVAVDDDIAGGAPDDHGLTGVALLVTSGQLVNGLDAYSVTNATDADWAGDIGIPSLVDQGVFVAEYLYHNTPREGVTMTAGGSPAAGSDFYMDDVDPTMRTSVSTTQPSTGPNGIGMITNFGGLPQFSGQGGSLPAGCEWSSGQAGAVPGVMFFSRRFAVNNGTTTLCP